MFATTYDSRTEQIIHKREPNIIVRYEKSSSTWDRERTKGNERRATCWMSFCYQLSFNIYKALSTLGLKDYSAAYRSKSYRSIVYQAWPPQPNDKWKDYKWKLNSTERKEWKIFFISLILSLDVWFTSASFPFENFFNFIKHKIVQKMFHIEKFPCLSMMLC